MFTVRGLKPKDIERPPVKGCKCTYCHNIRVHGFAVRGERSAPSHRLAGGNERHNPENYGRLLLKKLVSPKQFRTYVSWRGGRTLSWYGRSRLRYISGRLYNGGDTGHYISVYKKRLHVATICIPLRDRRVPLVDIVIAHYLACTSDERYIWQTGTVTSEHWDGDSAVKIPKRLREVIKHWN